VDKPIQLKKIEFEEQLVKLINESKLPAFVLRILIEKILKQLENIEVQELTLAKKKYQKALEEEEKKKESEKNGAKQNRTPKV